MSWAASGMRWVLSLAVTRQENYRESNQSCDWDLACCNRDSQRTRATPVLGDTKTEPPSRPSIEQSTWGCPCSARAVAGCGLAANRQWLSTVQRWPQTSSTLPPAI